MSNLNPCMTCGACCAFFRVSFYWAEADDAGGTIPARLTEQISPFHRCMSGTNQKNPRCIALQEPRAKMPAARYIKIDRPHAENSPCLVRTESSMRLAIVQGLNTGWHRYKYTIIICTAPPAVIAGLRFQGNKPDTSSICQQQCLSSVAFFGSTSSWSSAIYSLTIWIRI